MSKKLGMAVLGALILGGNSFTTKYSMDWRATNDKFYEGVSKKKRGKKKKKR